MGFLNPPKADVTAPPPPPMAPPAYQATKPAKKPSMQTTFLGKEMTPVFGESPGGMGGTERGHTLLGQA